MSQASDADSLCRVNVLLANGTVVATHDWRPGAWPGGPDVPYVETSFSYPGNGAGDVRLQVESVGAGRYCCYFDNLTAVDSGPVVVPPIAAPPTPSPSTAAPTPRTETPAVAPPAVTSPPNSSEAPASGAPAPATPPPSAAAPSASATVATAVDTPAPSPRPGTVTLVAVLPPAPPNSTTSLPPPAANETAPPPERRVGATAAIIAAGIPESAATAVVATAYGSTVVAGLLSPTTASQATSAARVAGVGVCAGAEDDGDEPDPMLFVAVVPIGALGTTPFERRAAGAMISTVALLLAACGVAAVLSRNTDAGTEAEPKNRKTARRIAVILVALLLAYHGPNVTNLATTVLVGAGTASSRIVAGVAAVVVAAVSGACFFPLWKKFDANLVEFPNGVPAHGEAFAAVQRSLEPLYDAARALADPMTRLLTAEDLAVAHAIAVLTGIRPSSPGACTGVGVAVIAVAAAHLFYLGRWRPYGVALEHWLAVANGVMQLALGVLSAAAVNHPAAMAKPLGYTLVAADAMFFVQLLVLAGATLTGKLAAGRAATRPSPDTADPAVAVAMLQLPLAPGDGTAAEAAVSNPLARA